MADPNPMKLTGTLYIVATPIGNLGDMTLRAVEILKAVDIIVCEDTRHSQKLLSHFGIHKKLMSYFEYSSTHKADKLIGLLKEGQHLAYVSDAGTPTISDPGSRLVWQARQEGIDVVPIPGASSITAILSASGFPTQPFHFWGFLSPKPSKRKRFYEQMEALEGTHVIFESPHRLLKRVAELATSCPGINIFIAKELTKQYETFFFGLVESVLAELQSATIKGEYVILLSRKLL